MSRYINGSLAERFPDQAERFDRLIREDDLFQAICEDYEEAVRAHRHFAAETDGADTRAEDYRQIVQELEAEAAAVLSTARPG